LIYVRPNGDQQEIEGRVIPGQTVLIIDDLMTGGTSLLSTAWTLEKNGLAVRDAIVLIDREQGGTERLHQHGYRVMPILKLKTMLTYYFESGLMKNKQYHEAMDYLERTKRHGSS
jgi:orotate phosphoribosyltransferase